jgi:acyl-CoA synthetase (AMP-forming)/AMP-acid ligase II
MNYGEWNAAVFDVARGLLEFGLRPGDHLALLAENRIEWPVVQMAAARAGLVLVPINTRYRRQELAYALKQSQSRGLVLSREFRSNKYLEMITELRPELPRLEYVFLLGSNEQDCIAYEHLLSSGGKSKMHLPELRGEDIAALIYTSGTTGFLKGALLTHLGMLANGFGTARRLGLLSMVPLFHSAGCVGSIYVSLAAGACYIGLQALDPVDVFQLIDSENATAVVGITTGYLAMLEHPRRREFDLTTLRIGTVGGSDVDPSLMRRCAEQFPLPGIVQVYALTEASTVVTCSSPEDPDRFDTAGLPLPGAEIRIADPLTCKCLPPGQVGEVQVRGVMVMSTYFDNPEATREALVEGGWLRTGDLGFLRPDGKLIMSGGRLKDMIIRGGENIYPVEIEMVLSQHPAVAEVAVFGLRDAFYGEVVAAAVRCKEATRAAHLARFCNERLAKFKVPTAYYRVDNFPMTTSGKIRKAELQEMAGKRLIEELP